MISQPSIVIRLTMETGTIVVVFALLDLVLYLEEHNTLHQAFGVVLGKLYSNSLLVLFNNRLVDWNKSEGVDISDEEVAGSVLSFRAPPRKERSTSTGTPSITDSEK
jgi:hypothetical protein